MPFFIRNMFYQTLVTRPYTDNIRGVQTRNSAHMELLETQNELLCYI